MWWARFGRSGEGESILSKISLENLQLFGYHGVRDEERERGQLFSIDTEIEFDSPHRDDLSETIDYVRVIEGIREVNEARTFQLIETFAQAIADKILKDFRQARRVVVRVKKLRPTIAAGITLDAVAAEVIREGPHPRPHKVGAGPCACPWATTGGCPYNSPVGDLRERDAARRGEGLTISMVRAFIGLGANLGQREDSLERAIGALAQTPGVLVRKRSELYETEPLGGAEQPWFVNAVVEIETDLSPRELLGVCKRIERSLGRRERVRWGPREIDLDILLYDNIIVNEPDLQIPHAHLHQRRFVLVPLAEIAPGVVHPILHKTIAQLLQSVDDSKEVKPLRSQRF
ncbi:MAG: 2-amino-4-hydroxy-6-hydroxymethyldihydropteridine diphosphokinase [Candidatus Bipolaricaulia bacterium]